ncbi:TM1812 family CRISPR-associated protein [Geoglobus acetivorans]|uniref:TIGR01897 family CRISPR-associated protein n=1 Tax=Geoglobus acetivorans TaxID=565033 RepID=A0ABZ3H3J4_GEOAI|nr:hypothetical protein [Geoglobus acetivorans]
MTTIFQVIGKPESYQEKEFTIDGVSYTTPLCSDALRRHLMEKGEEVDLTIFVPESMLIKDNLDTFKEKLADKGIDDFETVTIPPVGRYREQDVEVYFSGSVETIATAIFLHLLKERPGKLFIDLSTGFNIYPVSLLEATKRYLTYRKMEKILQGSSDVDASAIFTPPVTRTVQSYIVEIQHLDVKAFFSLPNANIDKIVKLCPESLKDELGRINRENAGLKKEFRHMFEELRLAYNAIRLNIPLTFYELLQMSYGIDELERKIVRFVEKLLEPHENGNRVERFPLDGVNVSNVFYAIAMFRSIREFRESLSEPEIDEILEKFTEVYRNRNTGTGVNEYFLQRDVNEIKKHSEKLSDGETELLGMLIHGQNFYKSSASKRNFFAHSGFLQEYTLVERKNGKIILRWAENRRKEIKNWILNPEKN